MPAELSKLWKNMFSKGGSKGKATTLSTPPSPSQPSTTLPTDYSCEIERVFRYIDSNGDGKISPSELRQCVKAVGVERLSVGVERLSAAEAEAAVESSDSDGDGLLSLAEFEVLMSGETLSPAEKTAELMAVFDMYSDEKEEGCVITGRSLKRMLGRLGEGKTVKECKAVIAVYDVNGDGVLSFDEFALMMR